MLVPACAGHFILVSNNIPSDPHSRGRDADFLWALFVVKEMLSF